MISVQNKTTAWADIFSLREIHFLSVPTITTVLGRIGRVDFNNSSTSIFSFVKKLIKEHAPCHIRDTFCQAMIMHHSVYAQVFNKYITKGINNFSGELVSKVGSSKSNSFINTGNNLLGLLSLYSSLITLGEFSLCLRKCFLSLPEKLGISDFLSCRKIGKTGDPYINTNRIVKWFSGSLLYFTGKTYEPFACRAFADCGSFSSSLNIPVFFYLNIANLGDTEFVISNTTSTLRESHAVISAEAFKSRIARILSGLAPTKERFESKINPYCNILKNLRMSIVERWKLYLSVFQCIGLRIVIEVFFGILPSSFSLRKKMVIEHPAVLKLRVEYLLLFLCRKYSELETLKHSYIIRLNTLRVNTKEGRCLTSAA